MDKPDCSHMGIFGTSYSNTEPEMKPMTDNPSAEDALEPCPHCGHADVRMGRKDNGDQYVFCHECHCEGPPADDNRQRAAYLWNLRADQTAPDTQKPAGDALEIFDKCWSFEGYGHTEWYKVIRAALTGDCGGGDELERHDWSGDGDHCKKCGDSWYAGPVFCSGKKPLTADNAKRGD